MPNYQNGKIYSLSAPDVPEIYIGSTCETLQRRFQKHISDYKRWLKDGADWRTSYYIVQHPNATITLIEEFPCNSMEELTAREYELMKDKNVCNRMKKVKLQKNVPPPSPPPPIFLPFYNSSKPLRKIPLV